MKNTITKTERQELRAEYAKAWSAEDMIDYCTAKVAAFAVLPDGGIVTVDKQRIEKNFCFGESGYDYNDALAAAQHARTSADYFKNENMKHFESWLRELADTLDDSSYSRLLIYPIEYTGQAEDCRLRGVGFERLSEIIDACGGSCYLHELPGKELTVRGRACRVATPEEVELIIEAYKSAAAAHEKKVDAYLKRYGLSQVHSWTYWRDA